MSKSKTSQGIRGAASICILFGLFVLAPFAACSMAGASMVESRSNYGISRQQRLENQDTQNGMTDRTLIDAMKDIEIVSLEENGKTTRAWIDAQKNIVITSIEQDYMTQRNKDTVDGNVLMDGTHQRLNMIDSYVWFAVKLILFGFAALILLGLLFSKKTET